MQNLNKIQALREIIYANLDPLIDEDYSLLDFPNHPNIGDSLIWAGELEYLKRVKFKCLYAGSHIFFDEKKIQKSNLILFHGGGNFGDLWHGPQDLRRYIIKKYPNKKIIILPQTVHYIDSNLFEKDLAILNKHKNLTICVRDFKSFETLSPNLSNVKVLLLPDMAFCLDFECYINSEKKGKMLFLKRKDKELLNTNYTTKIENYLPLTTYDWPTLERGLIKNTLLRIVNRSSKALFKIPLFRFFYHPLTGLSNHNRVENNIKIGIDFINTYDEIYATRLHGLILSVLLDKKVHLFDNSYGKNSSFFNTWMKGFKNVSLIN